MCPLPAAAATTAVACRRRCRRHCRRLLPPNLTPCRCAVKVTHSRVRQVYTNSKSVAKRMQAAASKPWRELEHGRCPQGALRCGSTHGVHVHSRASRCPLQLAAAHKPHPMTEYQRQLGCVAPCRFPPQAGKTGSSSSRRLRGRRASTSMAGRVDKPAGEIWYFLS